MTWLQVPRKTLTANVNERSPQRSQPPVTRYGYQEGYRQLQGKLEYSPSRREWKLRYIPVDGDTDKYGGSVAISNADVLDDFTPGDFVSVEGGVVQEAESGSFAPTYSIARVTSQPD